MAGKNKVDKTSMRQQTAQPWGNDLGVRIMVPLAKTACFALGLPVTIEAVDGGIFLRAAGKPQLTLAQKLKTFDPELHGGEAMASGRLGKEVFW